MQIDLKILRQHFNLIDSKRLKFADRLHTPAVAAAVAEKRGHQTEKCNNG
jgi:hypothetical protein